MQQYLNVLARIMAEGVDNPNDRTGHGRKRVFGVFERFDISNGRLPLVTTRFINVEHAIFEMMMFIYGITNVKYLNDNGVKIWDAWAVTEKTPRTMLEKFVEQGYITVEQAALSLMEFDKAVIGEFGPMYGSMWRFWPTVSQEVPNVAVIRKVKDLPSDQVAALTKSYEGLTDAQKKETPLDKWLIGHYYSCVDQLNELICNLRDDPFGSRHYVTALNPEFNPVGGFTPDENVLLGKGSLMPCHIGFQVFVNPPKEVGGKNRLSLMFSMRSADCPVGVPTNIAFYAILANVLAHVLGMETDELIWQAGDAHIYLDQVEGVKEQLTRSPHPSPTISINPELTDLFKIQRSDITVTGYAHDPVIKYPVAV